uniref:SERPIN domain-containing protein n=1 Tax=Angiostrongylus cantonensis TaxID=6313 RepID=A0A158PBU4_ANGCA
MATISYRTPSLAKRFIQRIAEKDLQVKCCSLEEIFSPKLPPLVVCGHNISITVARNTWLIGIQWSDGPGVGDEYQWVSTLPLSLGQDVFLTSEMDFGLDLLRWAAVDESLVVSPASIIFALTVIQAGANCQTKAQLNSVLCKGASDLEIRHHYSKLVMNISEAKSGVQSMIANGFFMDKRFTIVNEYRELIEKDFNAKVEACDFQSPHEAAKVVYMRTEEAQRFYAENKDMKVLSLQYTDSNYAFSILLPKKRFGLNALRNKLSGEKILKILAELKLTNVSMDEESTTAAAATSTKMSYKSLKSELKAFLANHPFIFVVTMSSHPLLMGQFT